MDLQVDMCWNHVKLLIHIVFVPTTTYLSDFIATYKAATYISI